MALGIECRHCGKFQASHKKQNKRHPANSLRVVRGACEKYEPISELEQAEQRYLKSCGYKWREIFNRNVLHWDRL